LTFAKFTSLTSALALVAACGFSESQLSDFGRTVDQTVQVAGTASTVTSNLVAQNEVTRNACSYLEGGSYTLAAAPQTQLSPLLINQGAVMAALGAYADAIAGALDAGAQAEVDAAAGSFATSVGTLGTQLGAASDAGPTVSLLVNAIAQIEENRRHAAVKAEMEKVLPLLNQLRDRLEADQDRALAEMDQQIAEWERHNRCVLAASRNMSNAEALFRAADTAKRDLMAKRRQAALAVRAMDALINAHLEILADDGDFEDGLETLDGFLADLQAIKDA
jgi:hypothetical protein